MAINPLIATIPQPQIPFLTPDGGVSRPWLYFLLALQTRTGGAPGMSVVTIQKQINSLFVEEAMADVADPQTIGALSVAEALQDQPFPAPINPILASLMVVDTA